MSIPPFVNIRGKPYLVVNYDLGGPVLDPTPCLPALLQHHRPTDILLLRPLNYFRIVRPALVPKVGGLVLLGGALYEICSTLFKRRAR